MYNLKNAAVLTKESPVAGTERIIFCQKNSQNVLLFPTSNVRPRVPLEIRDLSFTFRKFFARNRNLFGCHEIVTNLASQPASQRATHTQWTVHTKSPAWCLWPFLWASIGRSADTKTCQYLRVQALLSFSAYKIMRWVQWTLKRLERYLQTVF